MRVRAALAVSSQGAALLNGSDADGGSLSSSTGRSGTGSSGGCRQPPGDEALCRVRAAISGLKLTNTALLNGSDADGGSLSSSTGCINTSRGRETEEEADRGRASRTAVKVAAEAATAAEQAVARLWEIDMDQELEVSAQQACQMAQEVGLEDLKELEKGWLTKVGRPSNREVQQQLKRLRRRNQPGTAVSAKATMDRSVKRAMRAGEPRLQNSSGKSGQWQHLVADGESSQTWEERCARGQVPPPPFRTNGGVGKDGDFSLSAVREWLRRASRPVGSVDEDGLADKEASEVRDWLVEPRLGAKRAWPGGKMTSNAEEALAQFAKRKQRRAQTPAPPVEGPWTREQMLGDSAETFLEKMRPEGEADTPAFVQRLKEGALDAAEDFWR